MCEHNVFECNVNVNRILKDEQSTEVMRFNADVRITCVECGTPFRFIGLPAGSDLNGAAVSIDGTEARLCIAPKGEVLSELEGTPVGFTVRKRA